MTTTEVNWELVNKTLEWIRTHPEQHNQNLYYRSNDEYNLTICGSTYCFAGAACLVSDRIKIYHDTKMNLSYLRPVDETGVQSDWHTEARKLLGFTEDQAHAVFYYTMYKDWTDFDLFKAVVHEILGVNAGDRDANRRDFENDLLEDN